MGEIVFVGLGLFDEFGISLRGLEEVKTADAVFAEFYTSLMPNFSFVRFCEISGKDLIVLSRRHLEEE
ncbi:MAG: diphthine synthase, partial [Candidatus Freyarchaeota archaeon]|nr:diphthine synthase [Candidatus Jordarchaeia archaeon]